MQKGGPRPGPIDNHALLEADGSTPRRGLAKTTHYKGLHGIVFAGLQKLYGGGPVIIRDTMVSPCVRIVLWSDVPIFFLLHGRPPL